LACWKFTSASASADTTGSYPLTLTDASLTNL
jgi:hypothetical protein